MPNEKKQRLSSYDVMEISFVPEGAVEENFIKIVKNKGGSMPIKKSLVEKIESLKLENLDKITEIAKKHELSEDEAEFLNGLAVINKAGGEKVLNAFVELEGIQKEKVVEKIVEKLIEKSAVPATEELDLSKLDEKTREVIQKAKTDKEKIEKELSEARKQLKDKADAERKSQFIAKAKELPGLNEKEENLGDLLNDIASKIEKEKYEKLEQLLKSASESILKGSKMPGGMLGEIGTSSSEDIKDEDQKLEKIVKEKVEKAKKENKSLTKEQAMDEALKEHPELYKG